MINGEESMKACVATGEKRKIECRDLPIPEPEPGWILLKTRYAGICGSDLEYLDGAFQLVYQDTPDFLKDSFSLPTGAGISPRPGSIPGHEFIAEVAEIGNGVSGWSVGDRAIPIGDPDPTTPGPPGRGYENYKCMAEYFLSTPHGLIKVPDHIPDEEAVFVEPLSTGNGAIAAAEIRPGRSAVVVGAGKIGLLAAMAAKAAGAAPVFIVDLVQSRLDKAKELGIDIALNAKEVDVMKEVWTRTEGGVDAVLICVRDGKVLNDATAMVKRGGSIVLAGFVSPMEVNPMVWTVKRIKVVGILGGRMSDAFNVIFHKQIDPKPLISEIISFDECQRAVDSVYSGKNLAVLLKP